MFPSGADLWPTALPRQPGAGGRGTLPDDRGDEESIGRRSRSRLSTPRQALLATIETKQAEARQLLAVATHDKIREQIRKASRELDEAVLWLNDHDVDTRPNILHCAELAVEMAAWRLTTVAKALKTYGLGAESLD
jgi:hypothetical protein